MQDSSPDEGATDGPVLKPDVCVIGAGSGGLSVAAAVASFGVSVVLIEKGEMGGDCLNTGCVPSKALIAAAARAQSARTAAPFGVDLPDPEVDFARVHAHVHDVIAGIAPHDSVERFTGLGVRVIQAAARFVDDRTVEAGGHGIRARRFVVATGSRPAIPPIPGLDTVPYLTNETLFQLTECPRHLVIVGGGPIGMEMAQAHRRLGAAVTVIEADVPLAREEQWATATVVDALAAEGVTIRPHTAVRRVRQVDGEIAVEVEAGGKPETLTASHLLLATGRKASIDGLGLAAAGIVHDDQGIAVDRGLRTSNARVHAIGDVVASAPQFTHLANYHAGLVVRSILFRLSVREDRNTIPRVTYTDPEIAHVGLGEAAARERYGAVEVHSWTFADNDRARAERRTDGRITVVATARGRILGATIVGAHAGELIAPWALALSSRLSLKAMAGFVPAYPTLSEVSRRVAIQHFVPRLTGPLVRRLVAFLARFG